MKIFTTALASVAALALAAPAMAATLTTPLAGGNGQSGIMFDVETAGSALTLQNVGIAAQAGTWTFEVYTRDGTMVGNSFSPAGWTLRGSFSNVSGSSDPSQLQTLDIADVSLAANAVYGLYVTATTPGAGAVHYTNGSFVGATVANDANLTIKSGYGKSYAFSSEFSPRDFNGSLTYAVGNAVPEPATWAMMIGGFGLAGASMRSRRRTLVTA